MNNFNYATIKDNLFGGRFDPSGYEIKFELQKYLKSRDQTGFYWDIIYKSRWNVKSLSHNVHERTRLGSQFLHTIFMITYTPINELIP